MILLLIGDTAPRVSGKVMYAPKDDVTKNAIQKRGKEAAFKPFFCHSEDMIRRIQKSCSSRRLEFTFTPVDFKGCLFEGFVTDWAADDAQATSGLLNLSRTARSQ